MDALNADRERVERVLNDYAVFLNTDDIAVCEPVFDRTHDRYLLVEVGWEGWSRIYGVLLHIDLIGDTWWIQHDGTEDGVADELVAAGIPKERIVLGFRHSSLRSQSEFAVA
jgi:hypothetical protein